MPLFASHQWIHERPRKAGCLVNAGPDQLRLRQGGNRAFRPNSSAQPPFLGFPASPHLSRYVGGVAGRPCQSYQCHAWQSRCWCTSTGLRSSPPTPIPPAQFLPASGAGRCRSRSAAAVAPPAALSRLYTSRTSAGPKKMWIFISPQLAAIAVCGWGGGAPLSVMSVSCMPPGAGALRLAYLRPRLCCPSRSMCFGSSTRRPDAPARVQPVPAATRDSRCCSASTGSVGAC
jgi:hypothetical protein